MTRTISKRRRLAVAGMAAVTVVAIGLTPTPATADHDADALDCEALEGLDLAETVSIDAELDTDGEAAGQDGLPDFCRVMLTVEEAINIEVWLPTDTYNERFQAVGGGGYAGRISYSAMANALRDGYATSSTDTGHTTPGGGFALNPDGTLNDELIEDFASRSLIEMTNKAQTLIEEFYGSGAMYNYWNGCSTGGRQGLMLAQRLPAAYDGLQIAAPAINWDRFIPAELWPQVVMNLELGEPLSACKLRAFTAAAIAQCDGYDGVEDGILADPTRCDFDPSALAGQNPECGEITEVEADVMRAIWDGPVDEHGDRLWYGLTKGTPVADFGLVNPFFAPFFFPFPITVDHHQLWIEQDPTWDWQTLGYEDFVDNFRESQAKFNAVIGTDDPDLRPLEEAGGKIVMWHGWADQLIFPEGTIDYYERVVEVFKSRTQVEKFARLFMAPGVLHCRGGDGPNTFDPFGAVVDWVENGNAPEMIEASKIDDGEVVRTQPLCVYPEVAAYFGQGDPDHASSYKCRPNFGNSSAPNNDWKFKPLS